MQYTFCRDSGGSFLVFQTTTISEGYDRKMLQTGEIPYLLEEYVVRLEDTCEMHYRISGMQTLEKRYEKRRMRTAEIVKLLDQIVRIGEECASHLLPQTHLLLQPDLIFVPYPDGEFRFVYLPEEEIVFEAEVQALSDFMMKHVSYESGEDDGVDLVYALQDAALQEGFELRSWWTQRRRVLRHRPAGETPRENSAAERSAAERQTGRNGGHASAGSGEKARISPDRSECENPTGEMVPPSGSLEIVSLTDDWDMKWEDPFDNPAIRGGLFSVFRNGRRSHEKKAGELSAEHDARREQKHRNAETEEKKSRREKRAEQKRRKEQEKQQKKQCRQQENGQRGMQTQDDARKMEPVHAGPESVPQGEAHALIFADGSGEILLNRPFLLIGTSARNADIILRDHTVSRVHAELFCDASGVRIEDCNSSNGTVVDGRMLGMHEIQLLQPGMHIRMGRTEFVFR